MTVSWRPAASVRRGLDEADERWPKRNQVSDGIIGDAAHSSRQSDHNPDSRGVVHAFDLTHDPAAGVDCGVLAEHLRQVKDRRVRYVIWSGRLYRGPWSDAVLAGRAQPWAWELYWRPNPHTKHMHVSVGYGTIPEEDVSPWWDVPGAPKPHWSIEVIKMLPTIDLRHAGVGGDVVRGRAVDNLQALLTAAARTIPAAHPGAIDGAAGPKTRAGLLGLQKATGLDVDAICGQRTWTALLTR